MDRVVVPVAEPSAVAPESTPAAPAAITPEPSKVEAAERPAWLPEKFKTVEAFVASHKELEAKLGAPKEAPPADDKTATPADPTKPADDATPAAKSTIPGVAQEQVDVYTKEIVEGGKLSDKSYEDLAKAGYSKEMVDAYVRGLQNQGEQLSAEHLAFATETVNDVGGEEVYDQMRTWAAQNWSKEQLDAFNKATYPGADKHGARLAVMGLKQQFERDYGKSGKLVSGDVSQVASGDVFNSTRELTTAMKDPRYETDEAYRQAVAQKLGRSKLL